MNGRKVTLADLEAEIASEHYFTAFDGIAHTMDHYPVKGELDASLPHLTFCVLVLRNGTKIVGINHGPVDPAGFDPEYGRKDAREDAMRQVWPLLGFRLRDQLAQTQREDEWAMQAFVKDASPEERAKYRLTVKD